MKAFITKDKVIGYNIDEKSINSFLSNLRSASDIKIKYRPSVILWSREEITTVVEPLLKNMLIDKNSSCEEVLVAIEGVANVLSSKLGISRNLVGLRILDNTDSSTTAFGSVTGFKVEIKGKLIAYLDPNLISNTVNNWLLGFSVELRSSNHTLTHEINEISINLEGNDTPTLEQEISEMTEAVTQSLNSAGFTYSNLVHLIGEKFLMDVDVSEMLGLFVYDLPSRNFEVLLLKAAAKDIISLNEIFPSLKTSSEILATHNSYIESTVVAADKNVESLLLYKDAALDEFAKSLIRLFTAERRNGQSIGLSPDTLQETTTDIERALAALSVVNVVETRNFDISTLKHLYTPRRALPYSTFTTVFKNEYVGWVEVDNFGNIVTQHPSASVIDITKYQSILESYDNIGNSDSQVDATDSFLFKPIATFTKESLIAEKFKRSRELIDIKGKIKKLEEEVSQIDLNELYEDILELVEMRSGPVGKIVELMPVLKELDAVNAVKMDAFLSFLNVEPMKTGKWLSIFNLGACYKIETKDNKKQLKRIKEASELITPVTINDHAEIGDTFTDMSDNAVVSNTFLTEYLGLKDEIQTQNYQLYAEIRNSCDTVIRPSSHTGDRTVASFSNILAAADKYVTESLGVIDMTKIKVYEAQINSYIKELELINTEIVTASKKYNQNLAGNENLKGMYKTRLLLERYLDAISKELDVQGWYKIHSASMSNSVWVYDEDDAAYSKSNQSSQATLGETNKIHLFNILNSTTAFLSEHKLSTPSDSVKDVYIRDSLDEESRAVIDNELQSITSMIDSYYTPSMMYRDNYSAVVTVEMTEEEADSIKSAIFTDCWYTHTASDTEREFPAYLQPTIILKQQDMTISSSSNTASTQPISYFKNRAELELQKHVSSAVISVAPILSFASACTTQGNHAYILLNNEEKAEQNENQQEVNIERYAELLVCAINDAVTKYEVGEGVKTLTASFTKSDNNVKTTLTFNKKAIETIAKKAPFKPAEISISYEEVAAYFKKVSAQITLNPGVANLDYHFIFSDGRSDLLKLNCPALKLFANARYDKAITISTLGNEWTLEVTITRGRCDDVFQPTKPEEPTVPSKIKLLKVPIKAEVLNKHSKVVKELEPPKKLFTTYRFIPSEIETSSKFEIIDSKVNDETNQLELKFKLLTVNPNTVDVSFDIESNENETILKIVKIKDQGYNNSLVDVLMSKWSLFGYAFDLGFLLSMLDEYSAPFYITASSNRAMLANLFSYIGIDTSKEIEDNLAVVYAKLLPRARVNLEKLLTVSSMEVQSQFVKILGMILCDPLSLLTSCTSNIHMLGTFSDTHKTVFANYAYNFIFGSDMSAGGVVYKVRGQVAIKHLFNLVNVLKDKTFLKSSSGNEFSLLSKQQILENVDAYNRNVDRVVKDLEADTAKYEETCKELNKAKQTEGKDDANVTKLEAKATQLSYVLHMTKPQHIESARISAIPAIRVNLLSMEPTFNCGIYTRAAISTTVDVDSMTNSTMLENLTLSIGAEQVFKNERLDITQADIDQIVKKYELKDEDTVVVQFDIDKSISTILSDPNVKQNLLIYARKVGLNIIQSNIEASWNIEYDSGEIFTFGLIGSK